MMSVIWAQVRSIRPQKIDPCWVIERRREGQPQDDPQELGLVADEHLQGDPVHSRSPTMATTILAPAPTVPRPH